MKRLILLALAISMTFAVLNLSAGTLIYRVNNQEKIISDIKILSIDNNYIALKIDSGVERMPTKQLVKYYDTDIKIGSAFDDGSNDYKVAIRNIKNESKTGYTGSKTKRETSKITIEYDIQLDANNSKSFKVPYFYIFVLTTNSNGDGRETFTFYYPTAAKCTMKTYDEALMMEKVLSSSRNSREVERVKMNQKSVTSGQEFDISLTGVKDREIIAIHVLVWGKTDIVGSETKRLNYTYTLGKEWFKNINMD